MASVQVAEAGVVDRAVLEHADASASSSGSSSIGLDEAPKAAASQEKFDMVAASEWPGVPKEDVLLTPSQCRTLWRQFASDSNTAVQQVRYWRDRILLCTWLARLLWHATARMPHIDASVYML